VPAAGCPSFPLTRGPYQARWRPYLGPNWS
jgi:hypothetical protein